MGQCVILTKKLHEITEIIKDFTQSISNPDKSGSHRDKQTRKRDARIILDSWQMQKPKVGQGMESYPFTVSIIILTTVLEKR